MVRAKLKINKSSITIPFKAKLKIIISNNTNLTKENLQGFMENTVDPNIKDKYNNLEELKSNKKIK